MPRPDYIPNNYEFPKTRFDSLDDNYRKAILSDNVEIIRNAYERAQRENKDQTLTNYLHLRLDSMTKINDLEHQNMDPDHDDLDQRQEIPFSEDEENRKSLNIDKKEMQKTSNGCWSVSMNVLLRAEGVELDQEEIRSFRPKFEEGDIKQIIDAKADASTNRGAGENVDWEVMAEDKMGNVFDFSDLVLRTVPNTGVHDITWNPVTAHTRRQIADEILQVAEEAIGKKKPVSLLIGGHYRTIVGYDKNTRKVKIADSQKADAAFYESIDELIKNSNTVEVTWLESLKVKTDGSIEGIPDHFKGISYEKGKLVPGPGYGETDSIRHKTGKALHSYEVINHKDRFLPNRQERFSAPPELKIPQALKDLQSAYENHPNPAQGQHVETESDDPIRNADAQVDAAFRSATSGDTFTDLVQFAAEHHLYVSNRPLDTMKPYEKVLSRFLAHYAVQDENRGGATWYARLTDELQDFHRVAASIPDDPEHADWRNLFSRIEDIKAGFDHAVQSAAALHADAELHEAQVLYGGQPLSHDRQAKIDRYLIRTQENDLIWPDDVCADALNAIVHGAFHAIDRPMPAEEHKEKITQRKETRTTKTERINRSVPNEGISAPHPISSNKKLKPGKTTKKCRVYLENFRKLYNELVDTKAKLSHDTKQFDNVVTASEECLQTIDEAIEKGGLTERDLLQLTSSELQKVAHMCEEYEFTHDIRNEPTVMEKEQLSERQYDRLCIMSRMIQLKDFSKNSENINSTKILKERLALRLIDSMVTRLLTVDPEQDAANIRDRRDEFMNIRFKADERKHKVQNILSHDSHFAELIRDKNPEQLQRMLKKSDVELTKMYLKTDSAVQAKRAAEKAGMNTRPVKKTNVQPGIQPRA